MNKSDVDIANQALDALKKLLSLKTDQELADILGTSSQVISAWRKRGTINIPALLGIPNISLDELFGVKQNKNVSLKDANQHNVESSAKEPEANYTASRKDNNQFYLIKIAKLESQIELLRQLLKEKDEKIIELYAAEELKVDKLKSSDRNDPAPKMPAELN